MSRHTTESKDYVMSNIEDRVRKIVAEQLGVEEEEVKAEASFVDDLGADSLDTVELVMALEEEFETEIPDEEAEKITTVQLAIDYISNSLSEPVSVTCGAALLKQCGPFDPEGYTRLQSRGSGTDAWQSFMGFWGHLMKGNRVVVTGMGAVTPLGLDVSSSWEGICAGRSGAATITQFDASAFTTASVPA